MKIGSHELRPARSLVPRQQRVITGKLDAAYRKQNLRSWILDSPVDFTGGRNDLWARFGVANAAAAVQRLRAATLQFGRLRFLTRYTKQRQVIPTPHGKPPVGQTKLATQCVAFSRIWKSEVELPEVLQTSGGKTLA